MGQPTVVFSMVKRKRLRRRVQFHRDGKVGVCVIMCVCVCFLGKEVDYDDDDDNGGKEINFFAQ